MSGARTYSNSLYGPLTKKFGDPLINHCFTEMAKNKHYAQAR